MSFGILSPKVDFVFKKIFGNEKHPNIFLNTKSTLGLNIPKLMFFFILSFV